jgi:Bacterial mobilisation protein (MobC)
VSMTYDAASSTLKENRTMEKEKNINVALARDISSIGNNANQIAHAVNYLAKAVECNRGIKIEHIEELHKLAYELRMYVSQITGNDKNLIGRLGAAKDLILGKTPTS